MRLQTLCECLMCRCQQVFSLRFRPCPGTNLTFVLHGDDICCEIHRIFSFVFWWAVFCVCVFFVACFSFFVAVDAQKISISTSSHSCDEVKAEAIVFVLTKMAMEASCAKVKSFRFAFSRRI